MEAKRIAQGVATDGRGAYLQCSSTRSTWSVQSAMPLGEKAYFLEELRKLVLADLPDGCGAVEERAADRSMCARRCA